MIFGVNTSPLSGRDGQFVTSRQIKDRLDKELLGNVSIRVEPTDTPEQMKVLGRGELQLSILIEMMRREGFELQVSRPEIVTKEVNGKVMEPVEDLVIDVAEEFQGMVIAQVGMRRGTMTKMVNHGSGRVRLEFRIPARGPDRLPLAVPDRDPGHRDHEPHLRRAGSRGTARSPRARPARSSSDRAGVATAYAIWNLQERGEMFVEPAEKVYEGMIVGENARDSDMDVNITREKKQTNMRASSADEAIRLIPPRKLGPRAGDRVHQRRRAGRGDAEEHPPAQARARGEHAAEAHRRRRVGAVREPPTGSRTAPAGYHRRDAVRAALLRQQARCRTSCASCRSGRCSRSRSPSSALFAVLGPVTDVLAGGSQPLLVVVRNALFSGTIALGYAFGSMRRQQARLLRDRSSSSSRG